MMLVGQASKDSEKAKFFGCAETHVTVAKESNFSYSNNRPIKPK